VTRSLCTLERDQRERERERVKERLGKGIHRIDVPSLVMWSIYMAGWLLKQNQAKYIEAWTNKTCKNII
jgi:hypothetical protein